MALGAAGCSHSQPYLHPGLPASHGEPAPVPSASAIQQRLIFVGDAGEPGPPEDWVLGSLADTVQSLPERTHVVFLGDNIYPAGLPPERHGDRRRAEQALAAQVAAVEGAQATFVPGNHDWDDGSERGLEAVERQAAWLAQFDHVNLAPASGCAGPDVQELAGIRLVALDTQWWLHNGPKGTTGCPGSTRAENLEALAAAISGSPNPVVVVGHHPLRTHGPHGGFFTPAEWVFPSLMADNWVKWVLIPIPILGPAIRKWGATPQDMSNGANETMRADLESVFSEHPPMLYAAGHEHSLQVFDAEPYARRYLVSGSGSPSKTTPVGDEESTLFAHSQRGFMVLDLMDDGRLLLRVVEPRDVAVPYWEWLATGPS